MNFCEIGMVTCWVLNPNIKYEIISFCALVFLPLMIFVRLAALEIIFQKYKKLTNKKLAFLYLWVMTLREELYDNSTQQEEELDSSKVEK